MANYIKKTYDNSEKVVEKVVEKRSEGLNIDALANAIAQAIKIDIPAPIYSAGENNQLDLDTFDDSGTMNSLAEQMIVQRGNNEANFSDLGNIQKTKKDKKKVDDTIDILSKIND